jgi:hypothetical protein
VRSFRIGLLLFAAVTQAQACLRGRGTFERRFGGDEADFGYSVAPTSDRGCISVGSTASFGAGLTDAYLIKTNASGDTVWTRTFGGADYDVGYAVQQTSDGGYIVAGATRSFGAGGYDVWLVKTDASGETLWTRTFGGPGDDEARSLDQTADGGFVLAGHTESYGAGQGDVFVVRTDVLGNQLWSGTYGGNGPDEAFSVRRTADGGFVVAGFTQSFGVAGDDVYLIKTDAQGDTLWTRTFGGGDDDFAYSVLQTTDGGYLVAGLNESWGAGGEDFYLIRTTAKGDTVWTRTYGGSNTDEAHALLETRDGGFLAVGSTHSYGAGDFDAYLVRTDTNGRLLWTRTYGGTGDDGAWSVAPAAGGGFLIAGYRSSAGRDRDALLVRTDNAGDR